MKSGGRGVTINDSVFPKACGFRKEELGAGLWERDDLLTIQLEKKLVTFGAATLKDFTMAVVGNFSPVWVEFWREKTPMI